MKKIVFLFSFILAVYTAANAQVEVAPGTTRTFTVNQTNTVTLNATTPYTWTAANNSGTAITNVATVNATTTNSVSVTFGSTAGNTATLSVYATSDANCKGNVKTISLVIQALSYVATISQASQDICPQSDADASQTGVPASITVNFGSNSATGLSYTIDGVAQPSITFAASTSYTLAISQVFTNADAGAHTVEITSVTGTLGTSLQSTGSAVHTINVSEAPVINDIF